MTNTRTDTSSRTDLLRRCRRAAMTSVAVVGVTLAGAGIANAEPALPTGTPLGETATMTEQYGTGTAQAEYVGFELRVHATVTDTRSDSRCAYVRYRIDAGQWVDPRGKLVRVCGNGETDSGTVTWVGPTWSAARHVEVQVCREQGFGEDPCGPVQVLDA